MAITSSWILGKKEYANYYGIKGIKLIPHGTQSDAEVMVTLFGHDFYVNEPTISDCFWNDWIYDDKGKYIPEHDQDFDGFNKYMKEHASEVKEAVINNIKPIAVFATCNWGGKCILAIEQGIVISAEHYGDGYLRISKSMIRYNLDGSTYFMRRGRREKLSNYMRNDR